mgnify:FL=1
MCRWVNNTEKQGRSAPLLSTKKARGGYIAGTEENCGNGPSYFEDFQSIKNGSVFNYLRSGSQTNTATVRMNYCKPSENLSNPLNQSKIYQVSNSIVSTQQISDNYVVRYQAGTYIELNNGFVSGTDFVAEINPCSNDVTVIAAKTDNEEYQNQEGKNTQGKPENEWLKIYPTILSSGSTLIIESNTILDNIELQMFNIQGKHIHSFRLNSLVTSVLLEAVSGVYVLKAYNGTNFFTQKIVIQ